MRRATEETRVVGGHERVTEHAEHDDRDRDRERGGEAEVEMVMVVSLPPVLVAKFIERSLGYCTLIGFSATLPSDVADKKLQ